MVPISEYPVVYDTDNLRDAIIKLKDYRIETGKEHRSLLVFSKTEKVGGEEKLVGILTIRDILKALKRNMECRISVETFTMSWPFFYKKDLLSECVVSKTGDVLRPLIDAFIQAGEPLTRAIEIMVMKGVNILPVFEGNKAVGVVRALDLLDNIADML
ncbi:MAG: CBS domain-containing protein [Peptococcaceae bacterium]|nr:CBS domain-containing protein [Peptococcaceae bacterium]